MRKIDVLKRSVVGVCAATLLTGLCVAPAFAATSNETSVSVTTPSAQVAVTVPTTMTVTLKADGSMEQQGSATFTSTDSVYGLQIKSLQVVPEQGFDIGSDLATLSKNAFYGKIKLGDSGTAEDLSKFKNAATDFTTPATIPADTKSLAVSFDTLQVKSLSGSHAGTAVTPFKLVWTVSAV